MRGLFAVTGIAIALIGSSCVSNAYFDMKRNDRLDTYFKLLMDLDLQLIEARNRISTLETEISEGRNSIGDPGGVLNTTPESTLGDLLPTPDPISNEKLSD